MYGGAALNAAHALIRTLDAVIAADGRLAEPLREGIMPPTAEELEGWSELPAGADELAGQGARPADASAAEEFYMRTFAEPALDVNGIESGSPQLEKTVLPVQAAAQRVDPPGARPASRRRSPPRSSGCSRRGAARAPNSSSSCCRRAAPGIVPPDSHARSSSARTRSSVCSACARR